MRTLRFFSSAPHGVLLGGLVLFTLGACAQDDSGSNSPSHVPSPSARIPRSVDPRVVEARAALDRGQLESARLLVPQAAGIAGPPEGELLQARLCLLEGDMNGAERALAQARRVSPQDPRVLGTSAEIHAWGGMLETAEGELSAAALRGGEPAPELLRARGVVLIASPGGARPGLALLERAQALDPDLPFMGRALGQAHLLVGRSHMGTARELALQHAKAAVAADPEELDALVFLGDTLILNGEWGDALKAFEQALLLGRPMEMELAGHYKRAGFVALAQGHRSLGIKLFIRARALGLEGKDLGTARNVLEDEARRLLAALPKDQPQAEREKAVARIRLLDPELPELRLYDGAEQARTGIAAFEKGQMDLAAEHLDRALSLDPDNIEALLYRGHVCYGNGEFDSAVTHWYRVVDDLRLDGIELPEPLHLRLSDALVRAGRNSEAREVLEAYLVLEEGGRWETQTRQLLALLPKGDVDEPRAGDPSKGGSSAPDGDFLPDSTPVSPPADLPGGGFR